VKNSNAPNGQYTEEEAQRRFMRSLKGAVNTPPKPLKEHDSEAAQEAIKRKNEKI
jgi:hypothetical protein